MFNRVITLACVILGMVACRNPPVTPSINPVQLAIGGPTTLAAGGTAAALHAIVTYPDGTTQDHSSAATWRSSNEAVATVAGGVLTARGPGNTIVTASVLGLAATATVTVTAPEVTATRVRISGDTVLASLGQTTQLRALVEYSDGSADDRTASAVWTSSNPAVASVAAGVVTARAAGAADISAAVESLTAATSVTVTTSGLTATRVTISGNTALVGSGQTTQLRATVAYSDGTSRDQTSVATWASSNPAVATVASGLVTSRAVGSTDVTASVHGVTATTAITVTAGTATPTGLTVTGSTTLVGSGQTSQLRATLTYSDGTTRDQTSSATWSSGNTAVATVASGLVTSVASGTTLITASASGFTASVTMTVAPPPGVAFTAMSAGYTAITCGRATFQRNGQTLFSQSGCAVNAGRGFNVATIDASGTVRETRNFDTWFDLFGGGNGASSALVNYLNQQPAGTTLLIAVGDEAGLTLAPYQGNSCTAVQRQEPILAALEALGARQIRRYCYWNSYALITVKGLGAQAEQLSDRTAVTLQYTLAP